MNTKTLIQGDFRKWLLYSFDNQPFEKHYDLFKALKSRATFGSVTLTPGTEPDQDSILISVNETPDDLSINERQRQDMITYLITNYFQSDEVDSIMADKRREHEKEKNHTTASINSGIDKQVQIEIKPYPKETTYFAIRLAVSLFIYLLMVGFVAYALIVEPLLIFSVLIVIAIGVLVWALGKIAKGIFVGIIRGNSVRVTKDQYAEIYSIVEEQARKLKLNQIPEIYISAGHFNSFVTKFSRSHILMLYSEVVETASRDNFDVLRYVTAHELCHIKQRHLAYEKLLWPSKIVPLLSLAYSRACEFTCDRAGYQLSPRGAIEGILIMTTGKEIYTKFNIEQHIKNAVDSEGLWTWLSEKFLTHPHLYKRLVAIKAYHKEMET